MPKDTRKIYKAVRKNIDGNDYLMVKIKNLRPIDVRELRSEINILTTDFFVQEEPDYVPEEYHDKQVKFREDEKTEKSL